MIKKTAIWALLLLIPYLSFGTHIVGGVLNYAYNGGNIYTVTLKLYRDCGSSAAAFPANVTIKITGNNGVAFSPSKDVTMTLGTVTTLSANLLPCAVAPNPIPCVQQGIYTKTVSLPPNTGGYHLYYQVSARNLSLSNINGACNCIGESFYAYVPNNTIPANSNSNAVFNLFPPLFICAGQPFTFNHSATDADGDSLAYSLYTPYDNNVAPTYTSNIAYFPQVVYYPGFTVNNPLGASPFSLNPVTGLLTGTPNSIGQFVVGVKVTEYRHGISISQTLRDFQFNVLNCPAPPPTLAIANMTLNNGCSFKITATGISSASATWHSIYPGTAGAYNNFLSCTNACLTPTITAAGSPPAYVDYVVCGISTNCLASNVCDTFRVTFNAPLTVSIAPSSPALCNGQTATTVTAIPSGGTPPYNFLWNNVNPTQTISVGAGVYNIKLTDGSGCPPAYNSVSVTTYSVPVFVSGGADKTLCITNPVATLNATLSGANGLIWSGGSGTFSPNNTTASNLFYTPSAAELAAGSATLIVSTTGSGACPVSTDTVVLYYTGFTGTAAVAATAVSCYGGSNGSSSLTVSGGMAPYTYLWNSVPTKTTAIASNLSPGNYTVNITDNIGCVIQQTVSVNQPLPVSFSSTVTPVSCYNGANGALAIVASGGSSPYTYSWSPGSQATTSVNNLSAGTYTVKISDANACVLTTSFAITQPASLTIAFTQSNVSCFNGLNGAINAFVSGGTTPYTYSWNPGGATTGNITGLQAGTYSLTVKDNLNCPVVKTVILTQPPAFSVTTTATNETCNYLNNGSATVSASGGTAPYTYVWQPGNITTPATGSLTAGSYSLTTNDANGCTTSTVISISEPLPLSVSFASPTHVSCYGGSNGSVAASASGGTSAYSYAWLPGNTSAALNTNMAMGIYTVYVTDSRSCTANATVSITQPASLTINGVTGSVACNGGNTGSASITAGGGTLPYTYFWQPAGQTSSSISSLSSGSYTALITDAKGCTLSSTYTVTQASSLTITFTQTAVSCFNGSNGSISASVSGGNGTYTYSWTPGNITTQTISNITAGIYTITISDLLNCSSSKTTSVLQPPALAVTTTLTNETCNYLNNGTASVTASGGTAGYTYLWQPGGLSTNNISNLASGNYTVTANDSKSCSVSKILTITEPAALSVSISAINNVSCYGGNNGSATAAGSGGTANYSYSWAPASASTAIHANLSAMTYTIFISDSKACLSQTTISITQPASLTINTAIANVSCSGGGNGSMALSAGGATPPYSYLWLPGAQTTSSVSNLTAGSYSVVVHDANGCVASANYSVAQSSSLSVAFTTTQVSCFNGSNGSISASVTGGNAPYTYAWSYGSISTPTIGSLPAGTYTLIITDNLNCSTSKTVTVQQPPVLAITTTTTSETCNYLNNGTASVTALGGTAGYTYLWQPGALTSAGISGLASGSHSIAVTDLKGCVSASVVTITEPASLTVAFSNLIHVSCNGGSDGSATAVGSGGTPNYSYTWSPGPLTGSTIQQKAQGIYSVSVSDNNGCVAQNTVGISEPLPLSLIPTISNVLCNGGSNGAISISTGGGSAPYTNLLMPGNVSGANFTNLQPGTYSIITTDAKNCMNTTTLAINQPINISTATSFTSPLCLLQTGVASISVTSGGTAPFSYSWIPSGGTGTLSTALYAGSYSVIVNDASGCASVKIININNIGAPVASVVSQTNVSCFGGSNGALTASYSGGTGLAAYAWLPSGGNSATASNLIPGVYVIQVTDITGCKGYATSNVVTEPLPVTVNVSPANVSCFGGSNGSASAGVSGGTPGYTYNWMPGGITTAGASGLAAGTYSLNISDAHSCSGQATFAITQPTAALSVAVTSTLVSCYGGSDGTIQSVASGGTGPYGYTTLPGSYSGQNISHLSAGNYSVTVTDVNACSTIQTVTVNQPTPIALITGAVNSNCSLANGQLSVSASGGTGAYAYAWYPAGGTTFTAGNLSAGAYSVTVTDANNCAAVAIQTLVDNPAPLVSIASTTNVSCFGGADGAATAIVMGGSGPFTYSWLPYGGGAGIGTGFMAGSYSVTIGSANGCSVIATNAIITEPPAIYINTSSSAVSCFGGNNGSASVTVIGGTPAYSYTWQAGASTGSTISGLSTGTYSLLVGDANSCTQTASFVITQPAMAFSLSLTSLPVLCNGGSDGSINATSLGGTPPYNYNWLPGNFSGTAISNLTAGTYFNTATDANGCLAIETVTVNQPLPITLSLAAVNSDCGLANASLSVAASGGTGAYLYNWAPAGGTAATAASIPAGVYSITLTDANNCNATQSTTVGDNPAPVVSVASTSNVSCFNGADGAATTNITGGTGPFTYSWLPFGGIAANATGLSQGMYSVTVLSANGCTAQAVSPIITQPSSVSITVLTGTVGCFGGSNGSATVMAGGGKPAYTYSWSPGTSVTTTLSSLSAGNYSVTVTDANTCVNISSFAITQPTAALNASVTTSANVSCFAGNNGSATITAGGGTPVYSYNWLPFGGSAASAGGFYAGTYTATATDINGCFTYTTITITQPLQALSITGSITNVSCPGGSNGFITANPAGGTAGYSYQWQPAGGTSQTATGLIPATYTVTVKDANNCMAELAVNMTQPAVITVSIVPVNASCGLPNGLLSPQVAGGTGPYSFLWMPGSYTAAVAGSLMPATYTLHITDQANCPASFTASLSNIAGPALTISTKTNVSCFGGNNGSATVTISQGTPLYSISWLPSGGSNTVGALLAAGMYTVNVTDAMGCIASQTVSITEPAALNAAVNTITNVACYGGATGALSVLASGGTPAYSYSWAPAHTGSVITHVSAGTYTLILKDANSCSLTVSANVTEPDVITTTISGITNALCYSGTGNATVSAGGGSVPYTYAWNINPAQSDNVITNAHSGNYTVTVTDANHCTKQNTVTITQPSQVVTSVIKKDTLCFGNTGLLNASASGGTGNYYYTWMPGTVTNAGALSFGATVSTLYTVLAFDQNGCSGVDATSDVIVYNLLPANLHIDGLDLVCPGRSSVIEAVTNGQNGPLTFSWNHNLPHLAGPHVVTPANAITYVVTVANVCGASVSDSIRILINPLPNVSFLADTLVACLPGIIKFTDKSTPINQSDPLISWTWNFGDGDYSGEESPSHTYTGQGTYTVNLDVTTDRGCTNNNRLSPIVIKVYPLPTASFRVLSDSLQLPYESLECINSSQGASSYSWIFGNDGTSTLTDPQVLLQSLGENKIELIATSQYGCSDTTYNYVYTSADLIFPNAFTPNEEAASGGYYTVSALNNDVFFPYTSGVTDYNLQVFNRWGELIFESKELKQGWDGYYRGKLCQEGVYVWKARVALSDGRLFHRSGNVTLLR